MNKEILNFYSSFSMYTSPGLYQTLLSKLPNDVKKIGELIRKNFIHRTTLAVGNIGTNKDKKFGDMNKVPWYRQPEDDLLITAAAMLAELYRRDKRGLIPNRQEKDKLVLTCRYIAILRAFHVELEQVMHLTLIWETWERLAQIIGLINIGILRETNG